jgi:inorganic pyrophosphatase
VLIREPTFVGCEITVRPIGMLNMLDRDEPDEKIIAVPAQDPSQSEYFDIADVPPHWLREIEHFFQIYKDLEGKRVALQGWEKSDAAMREVTNAIERYARRFGAGRTPA